MKNICVTFLPFLLAVNSFLKFLFPSIFCQHKGLFKYHFQLLFVFLVRLTLKAFLPVLSINFVISYKAILPAISALTVWPRRSLELFHHYMTFSFAWYSLFFRRAPFIATRLPLWNVRVDIAHSSPQMMWAIPLPHPRLSVWLIHGLTMVWMWALL